MVAVVVAASALLLGACSEGSNTGSTSSDPTAGQSTDSSGNGTNGNGSGNNGSGNNGNNGNGSGNGSNGNEEPIEIGWTPFGPAAPDAPPPNYWYRRAEERKCSELEQLAKEDGGPDDRTRAIYHGVAAVCMAALEGNAEKWADAERWLGDAEAAGTDDLSCLDAASLEVVRRFVSAHKENPDREIKVVDSEGTACEWSLDRVQADTDPDQDNPARGPLAGGTEIFLLGDRMVDVTEIYFGDIKAGGEFEIINNGGQIRVTSPPGSQAGPVQITVVSPGGRRTSPDGEVFTYEDDGTSQENNENSETQEPTPTEEGQ